MKLECTQRKENCCAACNSKHQRVLQSIVAGIRGARLARLKDNRVGGVGICVDKTIADVNGINNRDVLLDLVDLDLEGTGERVARSNVLCLGYGARSWVVGAAIISRAINGGCVLWDDIGDGYITSSVGGIGAGNGVSKYLNSSYLVAVDRVALIVQNLLRKLSVRNAAYKLVGLLVQKLSGYLVGVSDVSVDNLCKLVINVGAVCLYLIVCNSFIGNNKLLAAICLGEQVVLDVDRNLLTVNSNGIVSALG